MFVIPVFVFPRQPLLPAACAVDAAPFECCELIACRVGLCACSHCWWSSLAAAGAEAEADGVAEVTKQLEKQAIEDKEKEEDGEEGDCLNTW